MEITAINHGMKRGQRLNIFGADKIVTKVKSRNVFVVRPTNIFDKAKFYLKAKWNRLKSLLENDRD